ncbi:SpvB/TcaC N-terminal domain-containing protein [Massilia sp. YIM B04103]|uniref:SpvB/TcaC N-terminal domain-containing protein n=1 Tax=Massilia sp. YIM B04103 TaxID=2963106 RepID=UPI0021097766|nr:SpvB/TcaC N-terminal domain-containing protein [Massilia sp. YIM B04103]
MDASGESQDTAIKAQQLSLPKGGGALAGMDDMVRPNPFNGTAAFSIPLQVSPCRGFEPVLSLDYASTAGNGLFGLGFALTLPSIVRRTSKGIPRYDESDVFVFQGRWLAPVDGGTATRTLAGQAFLVTRYRPQHEEAFARIERWVGVGHAEDFWRVIDKDDHVLLFGRSAAARVADPEQPGHVFEWLLQVRLGPRGDAASYVYKQEDGAQLVPAPYERQRVRTANRYPERICYGNDAPITSADGLEAALQAALWHFEVVFDYGEYDMAPGNDTPYRPVGDWAARPDPFSSYVAGFERRTQRRCRAVLMFHRFPDFGTAPALVGATLLDYEATPAMSRLASATARGYRYRPTQAPGQRYECQDKPALQLGYTSFEPQAPGRGFVLLEDTAGQSPAGMRRPPHFTLVDLHGEGVPGILYADGDSVLYREPQLRNGTDGAPVAYGAARQPAAFPVERRVEGTVLNLLDLDGNGQLALACTGTESPGYYPPRAEAGGGWQPFRPFQAFPTDFPQPGGEFADLAHRGRLDLVSFSGDAIRYAPSRGAKGYGAVQRRPQRTGVPPKTAARPSVLIGFADVLGTGNAQRVRVANGLVECWPNLGYGRFGAKVRLAGAPLLGDQIDASRLHFVDIDGSGAADLAVVHPDRVEIFLNHTGNGFAATPLVVRLPRLLRTPEQVSFSDVRGCGSQCLLFTDDAPAPRQWYYDFCPNGKPYLLNRIDNGLGSEIALAYASSATYALRDKAAGQRWLTRLPFPLQVVAAIDRHDRIAGRTAHTRYAYRDGYFDGQDREFRGFAMVERREWASGAGLPDGATSLTRTWYCPGAWREAAALARRLQTGRWQGDPAQGTVPPLAFAWPGGLQPDGETLRQAYAALAGSVLCEEVYGAGEVPLSVALHGQALRCLQSAAGGGLGIFYPHQRETLTWTYEGVCDPAQPDPRALHELVLARDERGQVLRSARLGYARRVRGQPDADSQQDHLRALCTLKSYEPAQEGSDVLLWGLERDERRYQLDGLALPPHQTAFRFEQAAAAVEQALTGPAAPLLAWQRWQWVAQSGVARVQKLLEATPTAAFDAAALAQLFAPVAVPGGLDSMLAAGAYRREGALWWADGSRQSFQDAAGFFQPKELFDPFTSLDGTPAGCVTAYRYDAHHLLLQAVTVRTVAGDVAEQTSSATRLSYRTLQPEQVVDANGIVSEVCTDALGQVVATSRYGSEFVEGVPRRTGFDPLPADGDWPRPATADALLAEPAMYLRGAQSFHFYDLDGWRARGEPGHEVILTAADYPVAPGQPALPIAAAVKHRDGAGRELQQAQLVPSGQAWLYQPGAPLRQGEAARRWQISARQLLGPGKQALRVYLPFFLDTWCAVADSVLAPAIPARLQTYDALARLVRTDLPKGGMAKAFFTLVHYASWRTDAYDANDTIRQSPYYKAHVEDGQPLPPFEKDALVKAAAFDNTPGSECLDVFGRMVRQLSRLTPDGAPLASTVRLDVLGRGLAAADPRLGPAGHATTELAYALNGVVLKTTGADSGPRWELQDAGGQPLLSADARGYVTLLGYDGRRRPVLTTVFEPGAPAGRVVGWVVYGDSLDASGQPVYAPAGRNLAGQVCRRYDDAGLVIHDCYGLAGKALQQARQFTADPLIEPDWRAGAVGTWSERFAAVAPQLDAQSFAASDRYDGAGRVVQHGNEAGETVLTDYDVAGRRRHIAVQPAGGGAAQVYLAAASYGPHGQREVAAVGGQGGAALYLSTCEYDPATQLLVRQSTMRCADGKLVQQLRYIHDPVGNISHIEKGAALAGDGPVSPDCDYTLDALYRMIGASGRAHRALSQAALASGAYDTVFQVGHSLNDATAVVRYAATYQYDEGSNMRAMCYVGGVGGGATRWTRSMRVAETSNKAVNADDFSGPVAQAFDAGGNQTWLNGARRLAWNHANALRSIAIVERGPDEPPDAQYFSYDHAGLRVRKTTRRKVGGEAVQELETLYFEGLEIVRTRHGDRLSGTVQRLRVLDGEVCLAECLSDNGSAPQLRYQLSDRQHSALMELDAQGRLLSYEEYSPYGATVFALGPSLVEVSAKRYRFGGKERDPASGLAYFGARYYAPWLARWLNPDPAGTKDGLNLYAYARGNPATLADPDGTSSRSPDRPSQQGFFRRLFSRSRSSGSADAAQTGQEGGHGEQSQEEVELSPPPKLRRPGVPGGLGATRYSWFNVFGDAGGQTQRGAAPLYLQLGVFPVYNSVITNNEVPGTWAHVDTQSHEEVHAFMYRHIGINNWLQERWVGAPFLHLEETIAYTVGAASALRFHVVLLAPIAAFFSMTWKQALVALPFAPLTGAVGLAIGLIVSTGKGVVAAGRGIMALGRAIAALF